jgi:hypothetical protein
VEGKEDEGQTGVLLENADAGGLWETPEELAGWGLSMT